LAALARRKMINIDESRRSLAGDKESVRL
jgi:hypothetical protein